MVSVGTHAGFSLFWVTSHNPVFVVGSESRRKPAKAAESGSWPTERLQNNSVAAMEEEASGLSFRSPSLLKMRVKQTRDVR